METLGIRLVVVGSSAAPPPPSVLPPRVLPSEVELLAIVDPTVVVTMVVVRCPVVIVLAGVIVGLAVATVAVVLFGMVWVVKIGPECWVRDVSPTLFGSVGFSVAATRVLLLVTPLVVEDDAC